MFPFSSSFLLISPPKTQLSHHFLEEVNLEPGAINQSENYAQVDCTYTTPLSHFAFKYPSLKSMGKSGLLSTQFSLVQLLIRVQLFVTPWTAARQASLSITNSWSLLKLTLIKSVMPSNYLMLCCPLLLLPSIFPSIRVFSSESVL